MSSASTWAAPRPTSRISPAAYERTSERTVAGVRVRAPMLEIHTVAAGGGSICRFDGHALPGRAGQRRRGARPRLLPARRAAHRHRLQRRARQDPARAFPAASSAPTATSRSTPTAVARAVRGDRGARPAMQRARGGARASSGSRSTIWPTRSSRSRSRAATTSPATRCTASAARAASTPASSPTRSASSTVMIHPLAGVLSAYGMGLADMVELRQRTRGRAADLGSGARRAGGGGGAALAAQGVEAPDDPRAARRCATTAAIQRSKSPVADQMRADFEAAHKPRFGFVAPETAVVVETAIVEAVGHPPRHAASTGGGRRAPAPGRHGGWSPAFAGDDLHDRATLCAAATPSPAPALHHRPLRHHRRRARLARRGRRRTAI